MTPLAKKSEENRQAAIALSSHHKWHAPSVHCSYYRCIQLIIDTIIAARQIKDYDILEQEINAWLKSRWTKGGSHAYYFNEIKKLLIAQGKTEFIRKFFEILSLKEFRENSDYKPIEITSDLSEEAITLSDSIVRILVKEIKA